MWIAIEVSDETEPAVRTCLDWIAARAYRSDGEIVIIAPPPASPIALEHQLAVRLKRLVLLKDISVPEYVLAQLEGE
jgi:hypothetical protein